MAPCAAAAPARLEARDLHPANCLLELLDATSELNLFFENL
jgi:hypothetical protein